MKVAVEGCAHGELEKIYETIRNIEENENIKVDLLLCCGDFQSTRNLEDLQTMAVPKKYQDMGTFYNSKARGPTNETNTQQHGQTNGRFGKSNSNKINLNIFLSQAPNRVTAEREKIPDSEVDSSSEETDIVTASNEKVNGNSNQIADPARVHDRPEVNISTGVPSTAQEKRAQFQRSKNSVALSSTNAYVAPVKAPSDPRKAFNVSPSLTAQRRTPLVRAMSAPVRPQAIHVKNNFSSKKQRRNRKFIPRIVGTEKANEIDVEEYMKKPVGPPGKVSDVITLVSLLSSEGSDSEREEPSIATSQQSSSDKNETRPMPMLRKTVSFQENFCQNLTLDTKDYSYMLRRGSIGPLATRLHSNRPPTAPPVSTFFRDQCNKDVRANANNSDSRTNPKGFKMQNTDASVEKENKDIIRSDRDPTEEDVFPAYVCTIKERECWKLYQKMSTKGITVSYDTVLRGMLTPTEFRQFQKQREIEESKLLESNDAESEVNTKNNSN